MKDLLKEIENLPKEKIKELAKDCFIFFVSFLEKISREEKIKMSQKMEEFLANLNSLKIEEDKEKRKNIIAVLLKDYSQKFFSSLTPENQEKFKEGIKRIVERKIKEKN